MRPWPLSDGVADDPAGHRSGMSRRARLPRPGWRRTGGLLAVVLVGLAGAALGLLLAGTTRADAGPFVLELSLRPSGSAQTTVQVPPLGELALDTHAGPVALDVEVAEIREAAARRIVDDPESLASLGDDVRADVRSALLALALRAVLATVLGAAALGLLVFRAPRQALLAAGTAVGALVVTGGIGAASFDERALAEPRYTGLLANAPSAVGDVREVVDRVDEYSASLGRLVGNVSLLYGTASGLQPFTPDDDVLRVLSVSDLHLSPTAFDVIDTVAGQFDVDVIVDSGDLTDYGSGAEAAYASGIARLDVPYVWIRGNHDSQAVQEAVARQPDAVVLDGPEVVEVGGLRFLGRGDPRFTPDKASGGDDAPRELLEVQGTLVGLDARAAAVPPDVVVVHEPPAAEQLFGVAPLVLAGHTHERRAEVRDGTLLLVQGSTGGAGARGLEGEEPTPVQLSVVYLDPQTRRVLARDDITLGGLGLSSAQIERTVVPLAQEEQP